MTANDVAAASNPAYVAGYFAGPVLLGVVGVVLLILGLRRRSAARTPPPAYPGPGYPGPSDQGYPPAQGYPGPPAQGYPGPPAQGYPGPPAQGYPAPPPRPTSSGTALIIVGAVMLVLGGLGVFGATFGATTNSALAVGDCTSTDAWTSHVKNMKDVKRIDCSNANAVEQLAATEDNNGPCPDGKSDHDSVYDQLLPGSTRLCFAWNLVENQCYNISVVQGNPQIAPTDCTTTSAIKVVKRVDGSSDTSVCPSNAKGESYPQPARTYCFEAASNG